MDFCGDRRPKKGLMSVCYIGVECWNWLYGCCWLFVIGMGVVGSALRSTGFTSQESNGTKNKIGRRCRRILISRARASTVTTHEHLFLQV